jgi:hypothetical protein
MVQTMVSQQFRTRRNISDLVEFFLTHLPFCAAQAIAILEIPLPAVPDQVLSFA